MIDASNSVPDITLVLDSAGVIRQALAGPAVADEPISAWIGQPWAETVRDHERADIGRLIERARQGDVAGIGQVAQRFPSGLILPLEYTTVRLGDGGGLVAVGKQPRAVARLQTRLLDAQRALEQDYWKLRAVETRYRMLLDSSPDAVLTIDADTLRVTEINGPAARLLRLTAQVASGSRGADFLALLADIDRKTLRDIVRRARKNGMSNGLLRQLKGRPGPWLVRASRIPSGPEQALLQLQIATAAKEAAETQIPGTEAHADLIERWPDGFVVVDGEGAVLSANAAFVEMTQEGGRGALVGQSLGHWLGRPGADLTVLLANVERFGRLQLFSTLIRGALGSKTEVELSAAGECDVAPRRIAVLVRDIGRRLARAPADSSSRALIDANAERLGKAPLRAVVDETIAAVEQHYVEAALRLTAGNRTAAAQLLGLSRQSLHTKLHRYGLDQTAGPDRTPQTQSRGNPSTHPNPVPVTDPS